MNVHFSTMAAVILFRLAMILVFLGVAWLIFFDREFRKTIKEKLHATVRAKNPGGPLHLLIFYHAMDQHGGAPKVYAQMASNWADNNGYDVTIVNHYGHERSVYPISPKVKIETACPFYREIISR